MACPHVVGAAALLMSKFKDKNASQIREALEKSAPDLGPCGYDDLYGHGRVDVMAAAEYLESNGRKSRELRTCVEVTVVAKVGKKGDETKWRLYVKNKPNHPPRLFYRGGPYEKDHEETYTKTFSIPENKLYLFRVYDDYDNGKATYELTVAGTTIDLTKRDSITIKDHNDNKKEDYWEYTIESLYSG